MERVNPMLEIAHTVKVPSFTDDALGYLDTATSFVECQACKVGITALDSAIRSKVVTQALEQFGILICNQIEKTNNTVCPGAVKEMGDIIVPVLTNFLLGPEYLCSRVMKVC